MAALRKPRPTPQFFPEPQTFSTKKTRGTPVSCAPPPLPYKSAPPPISRVFRRPLVQRAQAVSFRDSDCSITSRHYNESSQDLYFDQCFQIESKIGAGSFGDVFKVRSIEDGKLYAVKRSRERFRGETDRKRKLEEVHKHEQLPKHSNCVRLIKAWEERQHLYIQTELCETSLSDFCEIHHDIPEALVWNYTVDLLQAINHLHTHDLIHLDIKPDNIFISKEGICKLGDFGLVLDLKKSDFSEAQEGDPKYLAPELMRGYFSKAADIFSLGITILEMAADLDLPRGDDGWHQLRSGYIPQEFTQHLSPDLKEVIQLMMNPNHEQRITAAQLLSLPNVKKIAEWRAWQIFFKSLVSKIKSKFAAIWLMFVTIWSFIMVPINKFISRPSQCAKTPSPSHSRLASHPFEWDLSISEDELFEDSLNLSSGSMGVSLMNSSSSSESRNGGLFHRRIINSTPALKRDRSSPLTNGSHFPSPKPSPLIADRSSLLNSSSILHNSSIHAESNFLHDNDYIPSSRVGIDPKNLMSVFDASSDEGES